MPAPEDHTASGTTNGLFIYPATVKYGKETANLLQNLSHHWRNLAFAGQTLKHCREAFKPVQQKSTHAQVRLTWTYFCLFILVVISNHKALVLPKIFLLYYLTARTISLYCFKSYFSRISSGGSRPYKNN